MSLTANETMQNSLAHMSFEHVANDTGRCLIYLVFRVFKFEYILMYKIGHMWRSHCLCICAYFTNTSKQTMTHLCVGTIENAEKFKILITRSR